MKSFGFNEQEITVEIPKPLLLADVAVRVMWPPYDPLTQPVDRRASDGGDKSATEVDTTAERLSTVADATESVQLENNEVLKLCIQPMLGIVMPEVQFIPSLNVLLLGQLYGVKHHMQKTTM